LQGFLHWMSGDDTEVKRDLDQRGRDEVRIMTVHGAKGLQAPIVFLPDTLQVPARLPRVLWSEEGLPLHKAHAQCGAPLHTAAKQAAEARREEEYHRLLYVAMTRAEDRLYVCGWNTKNAAPAGCWYNLIAAGLAALPGAEKVAFDFGDFGDTGFAGAGWRVTNAQRGKLRGDKLARDLPLRTQLPAWAGTPPQPEPSPPRPLAPSQPAGSEPAPRSPLGPDEGGGFLRGRLVHRLLQSLPLLPPAARAESAARFLALPVHGLAPAARQSILSETLAVLEDPAFAPLFGPEAAAEVPVVGLIGTRAISGRIDRLMVTGDAVLIVDYKTLRPVPASAAEIPAIYLAQLTAYRAAMGAIYPGRKITCALLWTDGPKLMPVSDALLALP
jgi:ATP-dependent helicase/nuclease subunit A